MTDRPWSLFSSMKEFECGKVDELLDSYLSGELTVETNHAILRHLRHCLGCKSALEAQEALREAVRRVAARVPEPSPAAEERLRGLLATIPASGDRRGRLAIVVGLLAAAIVVIAGVFSSGILRVDRYAQPMGVQVRCTLKRTWPAVAPDTEELVREAGPEWADAVRLAVPRLAGYRVLSAHKCLAGDAKSFHLVLRRDQDSKAVDNVSVVVAQATRRGDSPEHDTFAGAWVKGFYVVEAPAGARIVFVVSPRGRAEGVAVARAVLPGILAGHAADLS